MAGEEASRFPHTASMSERKQLPQSPAVRGRTRQNGGGRDGSALLYPNRAARIFYMVQTTA